MDIDFGILGRTALRLNGDLDEEWGTARLHAMLATLLVHPGRAVPFDTLINWIWPDGVATPDHPPATFYTYAARIRRWLEPISSHPVLHVGNGACRLEVDRSSIDYGGFRSLIGRARECTNSLDWNRAGEYARQALALWRGRPLDDLSSDLSAAWRSRVVHNEWIPANAILLTALIELGEFDDALVRLDELQADYPDNLTLAKLRLSALRGSSRHSEATAYYLATRRHLVEEGDESSADHLRHHHESLRTRQGSDAGPGQLPVGPPRQLRHDIPDFVGRAELLRALDGATENANGEISAGVTILDGMAGVGKTALAVHWAHSVRRHFPDGDFFANLNGYSDSAIVTRSSVVDDFLIALGRPPDQSLPPRARELLLSHLLADKRTLVILDNARNAEHVQGLVELLTSSLIIITSRQELTGLSTATGARRVPVGPMTTAESLDLLSARLGMRHDIEQSDRTRLAELCGGLPLMISVLAEHIATRSSASLPPFARQLDHRQLLVDIGQSGGEAAIPELFFSWSYQALAVPERRLFRLLSTHPGPDIGLDAACACDGRPPPATRRSLSLLVGAHLIEQPSTFDRYQFHDLLREFARHRAELDEPPAERTATEFRVLGHYLGSATRAHQSLYPGHLIAPENTITNGAHTTAFTSPEQARAWFDRERGNLIAAIQFAAARGHHEYVWRLTDPVGTFLDRQGRYEDSRDVKSLGAASARAIGDHTAEASTLVGLGMVQMILGDHTQAQDSLVTALRIVEETDYQRGQGATLHQLARLAMLRGDPGGAVELYQRCLEVNKLLDDPEGLCWTHCRLGEALRILGHRDEAIVHLHQGQFHAERIHDESAHASCLAEMGSVYRDRGDPSTAAGYCARALAIVEAMAIPDLAIMTQICIALAEINDTRGDIDAAVGFVLRAISLTRRTSDLISESHAHEVHGDIRHAHGDPHQALQAWRQAATLYERTGNPTHAAEIRRKVDALLSRPDVGSPPDAGPGVTPSC